MEGLYIKSEQLALSTQLVLVTLFHITAFSMSFILYAFLGSQQFFYIKVLTLQKKTACKTIKKNKNM